MATVVLLTPLILLLVLLCHVRDMVCLDVKFLILPQVVVMDKVVLLFTPLVAISLAVRGDGKVMVLIVRATIDLLCVLLIAQINAVRLTEILIKGVKNTTTPKEKKSAVMPIKNTSAKKKKLKGENSVRWMLLIKEQKQKKPRMPIGLMSLASDTRH